VSLPSPTLTTPSLSADQIQFQNSGLLMGVGTVYGLSKLEGLDKPNVRSGNTARAQTRGSFIGVNLLDTRTITLTLDVGPLLGGYGTYGTLAGALAALTDVCSTEGVTEYPLWIKLPNGSQWCCMARCLKKSVPWDITADLGGLVKGASVQFEATDPYFYSAPTLNPSVGLPSPSQGLTFTKTTTAGVAVPLVFGGGATPNELTCTNSGNVPCYPLLVITGPCTNPTVTNLSVPGVPELQFSVAMNTGDMMVIDCDAESVTYYSAGSSIGASRLSALIPGSSWFSIIPGANVLAFNSSDSTSVAGTLSVYYASATDGLT
jgi:hypothetical protein